MASCTMARVRVCGRGASSAATVASTAIAFHWLTGSTCAANVAVGAALPKINRIAVIDFIGCFPFNFICCCPFTFIGCSLFSDEWSLTHSRNLSTWVRLSGAGFLRPAPAEEAPRTKWRSPDRIEQRRSGLPADVVGRRVGAERPCLDRMLEVVPQRRVRCPDGRDAEADPATHRLGPDVSS